MNRPCEDLSAALADGVGATEFATTAGVAALHLTWPEANQRWLARCFAQLSARVARGAAAARGDTGTAARTAPNAAAAAAAANTWPDAATGQDDPPGFEPAHQRLVRLFGLSPFEGEVLLLCAGIECDNTLRQALAMAQVQSDDTTLRLNFAHALQVLPGAHWDALSPLGPLRHWSLVQVDTQAGLANARLRIDERVLHHLTGVAAVDPRLLGLARLVDLPAGSDVQSGADEARLAERIASALASHPRPLAILSGGHHGAGPRTGTPDSARNSASNSTRKVALAALAQLPLRALWLDAAALDPDARALAETALALDREAALSGAAVVVRTAPEAGEAGPATLRLLTQLRSPVLLLGALSANEVAELPERRCSRFQLPNPSCAKNAANDTPTLQGPLAAALRRAQQQFHVDADARAQALTTVAGATDDALDAALWQALRESSRGGLDTLAQRIDSPTTLADLVLPATAMDALEDIVSQLRHRAQVHEDWGFATPGGRGLGLAALFAGDSGTGKTYAAEAVANEAGLDLYRIDLALTVSKYIGETEKNLRRLFDAAEASGAVLLFDEADALFGKRSEVKDSHDRYANIEVAYLLQRIESYRGLAILTTNLKSSLDNAFLRRLRFVVNFPFPDEAARAALWRRQFPRQAPLSDDIDWRGLAKLHLTGGHIRAVALNAAFRAAAEGGAVVAAGGAAGDGAAAARIAQRHLIDAARAEYLKLGRSFSAGAGSGT